MKNVVILGKYIGAKETANEKIINCVIMGW
jgi:hypothetical protein